MAAENVIGDYRTAAAAAPWSAERPGITGGKLRVMYDEYTFAGEDLASTVKMGENIPIGALIVGGYMINEALDASTTLDLGDATDPDRYVDGLDSSSAAITFLPQTAAIGAAKMPFETVVAQPILLTTGGADCNGKVQVCIYYVVD